MSIKSMPGRIIAQLHPNKHQKEKTEGGIIIPENEKNVKDISYWKATVTHSSSDEIKVGDVVVFGKYAGSTLTDDYVSVLVSEILGIV
jgi:co-chaperonin GroES (HSP10)